jgi:hypothetical protein
VDNVYAEIEAAQQRINSLGLGHHAELASAEADGGDLDVRSTETAQLHK